MKQFPPVSFVMPAFNAEKYIDEAINSIKCQTIDNWQLVIVDDGSTDSTIEIAQRHSKTDSRIMLLSMPSPSGSAYQPRRLAILNAANPIVSPLDADDWIEPTYLEKLLTKMAETNADIVYPTMHKGDESASKITPTDPFIYDECIAGHECVRLTLEEWRINCNGGIIKKDLYIKTFQKFGSSLSYSCADELLTRQLLFMTPTVAFSTARYFYRINTESITRKKSAKLFDFLLNNRTLLQFTLEHYKDDSEEYLLAHIQNFHGIFNALRLLNKYSFNARDKEYALSLIRKAQQSVDKELIKPFVSPRYMCLLKIGLRLAQSVLRIVDSLTSLIHPYSN